MLRYSSWGRGTISDSYCHHRPSTWQTLTDEVSSIGINIDGCGCTILAASMVMLLCRSTFKIFDIVDISKIMELPEPADFGCFQIKFRSFGPPSPLSRAPSTTIALRTDRFFLETLLHLSVVTLSLLPPPRVWYEHPRRGFEFNLKSFPPRDEGSNSTWKKFPPKTRGNEKRARGWFHFYFVSD